MPFWQHQQCHRKSSFSFKTAVFAISWKGRIHLAAVSTFLPAALEAPE
jgi:hypothetical protein